MRFVIAVSVLLSSQAMAQQQPKLTLSDLPTVLNKMRDCEIVRSWTGSPFMSCKLNKTWASVGADGEITFFYKGAAGLEATGSGPSVDAALQNLTAKLNIMGDDAKRAVKSMGEFLPGN